MTITRNDLNKLSAVLRDSMEVVRDNPAATPEQAVMLVAEKVGYVAMDNNPNFVWARWRSEIGYVRNG